MRCVTALARALDDSTRFDVVSSGLDACVGQVHEHREDGPAWLVGYSCGGGVAALVDPVIGADPRDKHVLAAGRDGYSPPGGNPTSRRGRSRG